MSRNTDLSRGKDRRPGRSPAASAPPEPLPMVQVRYPEETPAVAAGPSIRFAPRPEKITSLRKDPRLTEDEVLSIVRSSPTLERITARQVENAAREQLASGNITKALDLADRATPASSSTRLLTNVCRCCAGDRATAHLDLYDWARKASCPLNARVLLALLELESGRESGAIRALRQNLRHLHDPDSIRLLILIHLRSGRLEEAQAWGRRLRETASTFTHQDGLNTWLESLGLGDPSSQETIPNALIDRLSMELLASERVIPSLVTAMERAPSVPQTWLLIRALERAHDKFESTECIYESLSRLALIVGDRRWARDWATRGLNEFPYSANLALVLARVEEKTQEAADTNEDGPLVIVRDSLRLIRAAADARPDWPDLQQALRRLEAA